MSLDASLRATFRNYSTFFLVVFVVLVPLHLLYGWVFHDVAAVRELHPAIAEFPPTRQVRGVGQADVDRARLLFWVTVGIEVLMLPLFVAACRAVLQQEARGEVTTVTGAWTSLRVRPARGSYRADIATALGAGLIALALSVLAELTLRMTADFVPNGLAFAVLALSSAAGRACGIPFLAVALAGQGESPRAPEEVPDLY